MEVGQLYMVMFSKISVGYPCYNIFWSNFHKCKVFVRDFITIVKIYEGGIYRMYYEIHSTIQGDVFMNF
jgi:hypothetical protein